MLSANKEMNRNVAQSQLTARAEYKAATMTDVSVEEEGDKEEGNGGNEGKHCQVLYNAIEHSICI